jgi:hypothetical protein
LGSRVLVYLFHQIVTPQNAMDRVQCQLNAFARKHNSQLARAPVGITQSHLDYPLF